MGKIHLPEIVGGGYGEFWRDRSRYRVLKGGKGSKKSTTTALNFIYRLMKHPSSNLLVVRYVMATHRDSTFAQLKWAQERLGVAHLWHNTVSPMEMTYTPTGQKILFRGFDDVLKLASTTVSRGYLCWVWIEEAFEIASEADFDKLDMSVPRGEIGDGLFKQTTLTFNPWSEKHWLKKRFFDVAEENVSAYSTNYLCNEFLTDGDIQVFEQMKRRNRRQYEVAGLGNWGVADGLIYDNWEVLDFYLNEKGVPVVADVCEETVKQAVAARGARTVEDAGPYKMGDDPNKTGEAMRTVEDAGPYKGQRGNGEKSGMTGCEVTAKGQRAKQGDMGSAIGKTDTSWQFRHFFGLDFGYVNDPTAFVAFAVNPVTKEIYIYDEFYERRLLNSDIALRIKRKGYAKERIRADSAEQKSIEDLRRLGIQRILPSVKGRDSVINGIAGIQEYKIFVSPKCENMICELSSYRWKKDSGENGINVPEDSDNHLCDALRYAMYDVRYFKPQDPKQRRRMTAEQRDFYEHGVRAEDMKGGWQG